MARNTAFLRQPLTGLAGISEVLRVLPQDVQREIMATALDTAARPIERHAKRFAESSVDTGALKDSITHVVRTYRGGLTSVALIGPGKGAYRGGARLKKGDSFNKADKPHNYAHLVEFGHRIVAPKAGTTIRKKTATVLAGFVAARPFMRPAVVAGQAETGETLAAGMAKGIEKTRARLVKAGAHRV